MLNPRGGPAGSSRASRARVRALREAIAELRRVHARWNAAWDNCQTAPKDHAPFGYLGQVQGTLAELAELSRQLDAARHEVLRRLLREAGRRQLVTRILCVSLVTLLSAGLTLLIRGCRSARTETTRAAQLTWAGRL